MTATPRTQVRFGQAEITRSELRHFDRPMTDLVLEACKWGWVGRISSQGHAILRAPDGLSTMAVPPKGNRSGGSSGRNTRADLDRWQRNHPEHDPVRLAEIEAKREQSAAARAAQAWSQSELVAGSVAAGIAPVTVAGVEQHVCPDCSKPFASSAALGGHRKVHGAATPCPVCERPIKYQISAHLELHIREEVAARSGELSEHYSALDPTATLLAVAEELEELREEVVRLRLEALKAKFEGSRARGKLAQLNSKPKPTSHPSKETTDA